MKINVYSIEYNRYLTDYELEENIILDNIHEDDIQVSGDYLHSFRVNLRTLMIQTPYDNACGNPECCTPLLTFLDDPRFIIEVK